MRRFSPKKTQNDTKTFAKDKYDSKFKIVINVSYLTANLKNSS